MADRGRKKNNCRLTSGIFTSFVEKKDLRKIKLSDEQKFQLLCCPEDVLFPFIRKYIDEVFDIRSFRNWLIHVDEYY